MTRTRTVSGPEFRRQMVELGRAGCTPAELAREFHPTAQSIRNWVPQSAREASRGDGGLTAAAREEHGRLRRRNRLLKLEREILSKATAWFVRETNAIPSGSAGLDLRSVSSPLAGHDLCALEVAAKLSGANAD
jgi:transposase